jgi:hypothetical protein
MIEHWLSAFNFDAGSNYLPNPGFEASSYWASSGAESSFAYTTSQSWLGSKAGVWTITPAADLSASMTFSCGGGRTGYTGFNANSFGPEKLFDGILQGSDYDERYWLVSWPGYGVSSGYECRSMTWFQMQCSSYTVLNAHRAIWRMAAWQPWPKRIIVFGSNVGSFAGEETLVHKPAATTSWPSNTWASWSYSNQTGFLFYRYCCDPNIQEWLSLGEVELFRYTVSGRIEGNFTGSNYLYVSSVPGPFYPGSAYDLGCWAMAGQDGASLMLEAIDPTSGGMVGSTPVSGVPRGGWVQFTGVFSVAVVRPALHLKITYVGPGYDNVLYIDEAYLGDTKHYDLMGAVQIFPEWELRAGMKKTTTSIRTNLGKLYTYKWGQFKRFEVPVRYISNSKAAIVNSWWQTADLLHWKVYSGGVWETSSVMIVNKTAPFNDFEKGYISLMKGNLELETT